MSVLKQATLQACLAAFRSDRLGEAEALARSIVDESPDQALGWKLLGAVLQRRGEKTETLAAMAKVAALAPLDAEAQCNLAGMLAAVGKYGEARAACVRALAIKPDYAEAYGNLGTALLGLGDARGAEANQRRAIALKPELAEAHSNLGNALKALDRLDEAEQSYSQALTLKPGLVEAAANLGSLFAQRADHLKAELFYRQALDFAPQDAGLHNTLGNTLLELGRLSDAEARYRQAISLNPKLAEAYANLGNLLQDLGQLTNAVKLHQQAIALKPGLVAPYCNLARAFVELGDYDNAEQGYRHLLKLKPDTESVRAGYADLLARKRFESADDLTSEFVARALSETWINPTKLARSACDILKIRLGPDGDYSEATLPALIARLAAEPLTFALLQSTLVMDEELEAIFTRVRSWLLDEVTAASPSNEGDAHIDLLCALARQCFINEYVWAQAPQETEKAAALAAAFDADAPISATGLAAIACYVPLHSLAGAERLLDGQWPDVMPALLHQQIAELLLEAALRESIPRVTAIGEGLSRRVRKQYEENPYPRWVKVPNLGQQLAPAAYFKRKFPYADVPDLEQSRPLDILIAGCGTGLHAITAARHYRSARIFAIDLSLNSLAFAKRKTQEMGITSIDYAQADIAEMGSLKRSFDIIETSGVLHHMEDPFGGWRVLLSLLPPGGFMKIGLYSEIGRRHIVAMQEAVRDVRRDLTPATVREARQRLRDLRLVARDGDSLPHDFYTTSACRDLLFHEQEHRFDLATIDVFLRENGLRMLGFEVDPTVLRAYRKRFPDDRSATRLDLWQAFENEQPHIFAGMYQFWTVKPGR